MTALAFAKILCAILSSNESGIFDLPNSHSPSDIDASYRQGLICAIAAFGCWGLFPLYWKLLASVPSFEVVCHRILWSFLFLSIVNAFNRWRTRSGLTSSSTTTAMGQTSGKPPMSRVKIGLTYSLAAVLISINWLTFIWAVNNGQILEASLGYYINPLFSVLLAVVCLGERMSRKQATAIAIAAAGVSVMAFAGGAVPWIAIGLACSFAFYGLVKKAAPLSAMTGLWIETTVLLIPAIIFLWLVEVNGQGAIGDVAAGRGRWIALWLVLGGCITVLPLAFFATAAQRVPLSTMGMLQYIGPTLQLAIGVLLFNEPFGTARFAGFALVWLGSLTFLFAPKPKRQISATVPDDQVLAPEL